MYEISLLATSVLVGWELFNQIHLLERTERLGTLYLDIRLLNRFTYHRWYPFHKIVLEKSRTKLII